MLEGEPCRQETSPPPHPTAPSIKNDNALSKHGPQTVKPEHPDAHRRVAVDPQGKDLCECTGMTCRIVVAATSPPSPIYLGITIVALISRIGCWGPLCYSYNKDPQIIG